MGEHSMNHALFTRWLIKGSIFVGLVMSVTAAILALLPAHDLTFIPAKNKLLESTPGPRVIVTGGSNVLFGQDSERLAGLLKMPVINDGLVFPLGMRVILNSLTPYIHAGDVVVISPEYGYSQVDLEGNREFLAQLLNVQPQTILSFEMPQIVQLPDIYILMVRLKIQYLFNYDPSPTHEEIDRLGDVVIPAGTPDQADLPDTPIANDDQSYQQATAQVFNQFARQARAKGATVVMVYPAARMVNCLGAKTQLEQLDTYLRNHLEFPILDHPFDSCYAEKYIYDSYYHLNMQGRSLRTTQLAEYLTDQGIVEVGR
jgi:hypothetical protein